MRNSQNLQEFLADTGLADAERTVFLQNMVWRYETGLEGGKTAFPPMNRGRSHSGG